MQLKRYTVGPFAENTYLLTKRSHSLLVDPGFVNKQEVDQLQEDLEQTDTVLQAVVLTHAHVDHILGLARVLDTFDVPVYLSDKDYYLWNNFASQAAMFGLRGNRDFDFIPEVLPVSDRWQVGGFSFDVRYTPGHAPDHVSLYSANDKLVLAGDALFKEGIGRTDLYKGSMEILQRSIWEELYTLPDETVVYPGHGPETTIGHEKKANPFVKA